MPSPTAMQATELRNFRRIHPRIGVGGIAAELARNPLAWALSTRRQTRCVEQRETESIVLRRGQPEHPEQAVEDAHLVVDGPGMPYFPLTLAWLRATAGVLGGELARALFARLPPGAQVYRHIDRGDYYACRDRFHLVIESRGGSPMVCGRERVVMQEGELWRFDNKRPHEASNPSDSPRVHLIFDLLMKERA